MTGFVRSAKAVAAVRDRMASNRFVDTRSVSVRYRTRPAVVEEVLPPGLEPTDDPLVEAEVVEVERSNCVGAFAGGGLYVRAEHEGTVGSYPNRGESPAFTAGLNPTLYYTNHTRRSV